MHTKIFIDTDHGSWDSAGGNMAVGLGLHVQLRRSTKARRMDLEKELLDAFNKVVHEDFPNPQRIDCPGRDVLLRLAQRPADAQLAHLLAHIRQCAPCFDELKDLRCKAQKRYP
jgi:hypothetical protein